MIYSDDKHQNRRIYPSEQDMSEIDNGTVGLSRRTTKNFFGHSNEQNL
jgi:hypothetical protein